MPPNYAELEKRLRQRGTDAEEVIRRRLKNAADEIQQALWYDYLVVNDDFKSAKNRLIAIATAERCRSDRATHLLEQFTVKGDK